jgi:predicted nuclease with TOPRIM domain
MGRIGISEYQVFQAADQLVAEGLQPSVDTVRVELGNTGSRSTINKYLKLWRERQAHRDAAGANLSGHLRQVITEQAELLLSVLEAESSAKLQAKAQEFEDVQQTLRTSHQQIEQAHLKALDELKSLQEMSDSQALQLLQRQAELVDLRDQNQSQREALAKEIGRREMLISTVNDRDSQLAVLQKELKTIQSRNEILNESVAAKAAELQQLQQRERDQRTLLKEQNDEIKRLNRELTALRTRNEKELKQLTQSLAKLLQKPKEKTVRKKA